jgi:hypothetical protein
MKRRCVCESLQLIGEMERLMSDKIRSGPGGRAQSHGDADEIVAISKRLKTRSVTDPGARTTRDPPAKHAWHIAAVERRKPDWRCAYDDGDDVRPNETKPKVRGETGPCPVDCRLACPIAP